MSLAAQAVTEGLVDSISSSTVRRWLHADAIRPWRYRSWIFPRDPDFAAKAARVLDLYARVVDGVPLGLDDYVISADEKSQLQALRRCHPGRLAGPRHLSKVEFEYRRVFPRPTTPSRHSVWRLRTHIGSPIIKHTRCHPTLAPGWAAGAHVADSVDRRAARA